MICSRRAHRTDVMIADFFLSFCITFIKQVFADPMTGQEKVRWRLSGASSTSKSTLSSTGSLCCIWRRKRLDTGEARWISPARSWQGTVRVHSRYVTSSYVHVLLFIAVLLDLLLQIYNVRASSLIFNFLCFTHHHRHRHQHQQRCSHTTSRCRARANDSCAGAGRSFECYCDSSRIWTRFDIYSRVCSRGGCSYSPHYTTVEKSSL
jgi:hypothetical protein